jgi:hypothetical protein
MSFGSHRSMKIRTPSPYSPPIKGGDYKKKSPLPLRERDRVRGILYPPF